MLNGFIVFMSNTNSIGGWYDVLKKKGEVQSFESLQTAQEAALAAIPKYAIEFSYHIVDLTSGKIVFKNYKEPEA